MIRRMRPKRGPALTTSQTGAQPVPPTGGGPLAVTLGLLRADAPETIMGAPQDWPRCAVLLPHVLAATSGHPDKLRISRQGQGSAG